MRHMVGSVRTVTKVRGQIYLNNFVSMQLEPNIHNCVENDEEENLGRLIPKILIHIL